MDMYKTIPATLQFADVNQQQKFNSSLAVKTCNVCTNSLLCLFCNNHNECLEQLDNLTLLIGTVCRLFFFLQGHAVGELCQVLVRPGSQDPQEARIGVSGMGIMGRPMTQLVDRAGSRDHSFSALLHPHRSRPMYGAFILD